MEIELELDNGFVCDFTPDFRMQTNTTDQTNISWRLSDRKSSGDVVVLCQELSDESSPDPTILSGPDVRLLP